MKPAASIVLAAGRGERMRPLSDVLPKPALPLVAEPVVASPLRLAAASGAGRVVFNSWHLADVLAATVEAIDLPVRVAVSREPELMGTAGGLALARDRELLGDQGPVLVVNGDGVLNLELEPVAKRMAQSDDMVTLALLPHLDPERWSRVCLADDGRVKRIAPPGRPARNEIPLLYPGAMLVSRTAVDQLRRGPGGVPERLWRPALAAGRLGGVVVSGHWREVGTPADYLEIVLDQLAERTVIHPTAEIHPSASVESALIGRRARIAADAVVRASVVAEGARIGRGARVLRSVVLGEVSVDPADTLVGVFQAASGPELRRTAAF